MPSVERELIIERDLESIWSRINNLNEIAQCIPGFQGLEVIDERVSVWTLKLDIGMMTRSVRLKATITRLVPLEQISFGLLGLNEKVEGGGGVTLAKATETSTRLSFQLHLEAKGIASLVVNKYIASALPKQMDNFSPCIKQLIDSVKN